MPRDDGILDRISGYPAAFSVDSDGMILALPISGAPVDQYERTVGQLVSGEDVDAFANAGTVKNDSGEYRVIVCDMKGEPVEGAVIRLCDDGTCAFRATNADGIAVFSVEEKACDVHALMVPKDFVQKRRIQLYQPPRLRAVPPGHRQLFC